MSKYVYSVNSKDKVIHHVNCHMVKRIKQENRGYLQSEESARKKGYRMCKCCFSIAKKYRKEEKQIEHFCVQSGFKVFLNYDGVDIYSRFDQWKIIQVKKHLFLYHKNKGKYIDTSMKPSKVLGYHSQAWRSSTFMGYLHYILEHDEYRAEHPYKYYPKKETLADVPPILIKKHDWNSKTIRSDYQKIKGTAKYRNNQKKMKKKERRASINRVYSLIDNLQRERMTA